MRIGVDMARELGRYVIERWLTELSLSELSGTTFVSLHSTTTSTPHEVQPTCLQWHRTEGSAVHLFDTEEETDGELGTTQH